MEAEAWRHVKSHMTKTAPTKSCDHSRAPMIPNFKLRGNARRLAPASLVKGMKNFLSIVYQRTIAAPPRTDQTPMAGT